MRPRPGTCGRWTTSARRRGARRRRYRRPRRQGSGARRDLLRATELRSYVTWTSRCARPTSAARSPRWRRPAARLLDANWPLLTRTGRQELRLRRALRRRDRPALVARSRGLVAGPAPPSIGSCAERCGSRRPGVLYLHAGPWDLVVQVAVHAASSGGHRLVWLADLRGALDYALAQSSPERLARRSPASGRRSPCLSPHGSPDASDHGIDRCLGKPPTLGPSGLGPESMSPMPSAPAPLSQGKAGRRAVWWHGPAGARCFAASALRSGRGGAAATAGRPVAPGRDVMQDPTNPLSALYPAGGTEGAEAFFARVAARDRADDPEFQASSAARASAPSCGLP